MAQRPLPPAWASVLAALTVLGSTALAQGPFIDNTTNIPSGSSFNQHTSENVDFGDVDLDGDWDAVFANGGDNFQQQNRIWINQGPANLGVFQDQTATRFPSVLDQSRDIDLVDFNNDGWLDIYVSNTAQILAQSNRWWRNTGGGFYAEETAARWVGVGGAGSSISPGQVLPLGGFIDFSCDCEFADIDNDGDLDLVHSSYGGAFGGQVPTRLFLNDGNGFFSEFNPSGFQLPGQTIADGMPGLWCEGTQQSNTTNSTGQFCDIASSALDIDVGDIDGDFDLDILHGARVEVPRMFRNLLEENGGVLGFRDVTGAVFPVGYSTGNGHYEQEMGDMDGDGDLDIYGLNWQVSGFFFRDITLRNDGTGVYTTIYQVPNSTLDHNEADFFDYDNDGDLDVFISNFSGKDKLYRNNGGVTNSLTDVSSLLPNSISSFTSLDGQIADVDEDGDYDVFVANDLNARNVYLQNMGNVPDTHAPYLPNTEQAPDRVAGPAPTVIRAHVYDNAPSYTTRYNPTVVEYTVNGGPPQTVPAMWSGHQVFRAELPGNLVGTVCYRWVSQDRYGNTGQSAQRCFDSSGPTLGTAYCAGDGSGTPCPCANDNDGSNGLAGCANSAGAGGAKLTASGSNSIAAGDLVLAGSTLQPGQAGLYLQGNNATNGGNGTAFGDGLRCAGGNVIRLQIRNSGMAGASNTTVNIAALGGVSAGEVKRYQLWFRDTAGPCGSGFNFTNGLELTWAP